MSTWLTAWRNRDAHESTGPIMELRVVAGADAGDQFTIEGEEVLVGRGAPVSGRTDAVRLEDQSISRRQAWIRRDGTGTWLVHIDSAANPTLLNGREISRARLTVGDRIEMGRVAFEVAARKGMNLSGFTEIMQAAVRQSTETGDISNDTTADGPASSADGASDAATLAPGSLADEMTLPAAGLLSEPTDVRPMEVEVCRLRLLEGAPELAGEVFSVGLGGTKIGRGSDVAIRIPELGVSRLHAEIEVVARGIELIQRSATNPTLVNGFPVLDRVELADGDRVQLADRVVLVVELGRPVPTSPALPLRRGSSALSERMEYKIDLDREIEEFNVMGTFLDVDVVGSRLMKGGDEKAEHIIVSFERFRSYVGGICEEWDGQVLNCNGDELMCFFESAEDALLAGSAVLERLADFNRDLNLLHTKFQFRLGVHTGVSLVDLNAGIAYSQVLDTAGHIQKVAAPDTLVLSERTLEHLPKDLPVTRIGELAEGAKESGPGFGPDAGAALSLYRVDRFLRRADFETTKADDAPGSI